MLYRLLALCLLLLFCPREALAQTGPSGQVRVTAPITATVFVDCEEIGQTPLTRYLPVGTYTIRVVADGFAPYVRRATVADNQVASVSATLVQGGNTLEFCVEPTGGKLTINGQDAGYVPTRLELGSGTYEYKVVNEGYEPLVGKVTLRDGGNPLIQAEMLESRGRFIISSSPEGAEVFLDGQKVGVTPLEIDGIEPGMHKVGLMLAGHGLLVRVVDTSDGSVGDVSARLNKGGTRTTIKAKGETIYLDGIDLGPDKARLVASRGSYTVKAGDMSGTISVKSGSAQTWVVENGELTELPALTQRPAFWVATGGGAAAAVAATVVAIVVTRPEPQPDGDIVVTMP